MTLLLTFVMSPWLPFEGWGGWFFLGSDTVMKVQHQLKTRESKGCSQCVVTRMELNCSRV